jgi:hypothetical protein
MDMHYIAVFVKSIMLMLIPGVKHDIKSISIVRENDTRKKQRS